MTAVFGASETIAVNCCVSGWELDGGRKAYGGAIVTLTGPAGTAIVRTALPLCDRSARLMAVIVTGLATGMFAGARKLTALARGTTGGTHGLEFAAQIWPTIAFPFAMPSTNHDTATSELPETLTASGTLCPIVTVAAGGDTFTLTLLVIETDAAAVARPDVTALAVA